MFRYGLGIQGAVLVIALREPIYKVLICRTSDLASLASFEISYRLCTQLVSLVASPLLGAFSVSALLCQRRDDLANILRPMMGFTCIVFLPAILLFGSFSPKLVALWLGREADETALMVFLMFTAFAVYYMTEPIYKAIEASGRSGYSALVQALSMTVSIVTYSLFHSYGALAISAAFLAGFSLFSVSNYVVFSRQFKGTALFRAYQLVLLLMPACGYVVSSLLVPRSWLPALFGLYLVAHLTLAAKSKVLDLIGLADEVLAATHSRFRLRRIRSRAV